MLQVANSGPGGRPALHFTVEAAEPNGPIRLARTYFLSILPAATPEPAACAHCSPPWLLHCEAHPAFLACALPSVGCVRVGVDVRWRWAGNGGAAARVLTFDYDGVETQEDNNLLERGGRSAYARCLMTVYCALIRVHKQLVAAFCSGAAADERALAALAAQLVLDLRLEWLRGYDVRANLTVECVSVDLEGVCYPAAPRSRHAKYLKVALRRISSLDHPPVDLGSVVFGETFLEPPAPDAPILVPTDKIEPLCAWLGGGQEEDSECMSALLSRLRFSNKNRHYSMGALLKEDALQGVRLLTGLPEIPAINGQLWVLQRGLIFSSARLGSIALDFGKHVASFAADKAPQQQQQQQQDRADAPAVLRFELKGNLQQMGILEANVAQGPSALVFSSGEVDRRTLLRDVLPEWLAWFSAQGVACAALEGLPDGCCDVEPLSARSWGADPMSVNHASEPTVQAYLSSLQKRDAWLHAGAPSESERAAGAQGAACARGGTGEGCRVIVFLGEPGCDKHKLVEGAMQLAGLAASWKLVAYRSARSPLHVDANDLASCLLDASAAPLAPGPIAPLTCPRSPSPSPPHRRLGSARRPAGVAACLSAARSLRPCAYCVGDRARACQARLSVCCSRRLVYK